MKRCPECRRDYYDDSLLYCLDDGTALLEGPASGNEPATALLPGTDLRSIRPRFRQNRRLWMAFGLISVPVIGGIAIYWINSQNKPDVGSTRPIQIERLTTGGLSTS